MTPDIKAICNAIRQPDPYRAPAITTLAELWADNALTDAETRAGISALTDAALNFADSGAMGLLGQMHLVGVNGVPDIDAALAWFRKAAAFGNSHAIGPAAGCALILSQDREPDYCGPLTLRAIGWAALALNHEPDPVNVVTALSGLAEMQAEYGLTPAQMHDAMQDAARELSKEH